MVGVPDEMTSEWCWVVELVQDICGVDWPKVETKSTRELPEDDVEAVTTWSKNTSDGDTGEGYKAF